LAGGRPAIKQELRERKTEEYSERTQMPNKDMLTGMVAPACNSSYSGVRGRRMVSSRPAWAKLGDPHLKNKMQTKGLVVWLEW
jgi:hypothetical protein